MLSESIWWLGEDEVYEALPHSKLHESDQVVIGRKLLSYQFKYTRNQ